MMPTDEDLGRAAYEWRGRGMADTERATAAFIVLTDYLTAKLEDEDDDQA